jgi:hypothetical protein
LCIPGQFTRPRNWIAWWSYSIGIEKTPMDERRELAAAIATNTELYDVVSRHGLTDADLLHALKDLRENGQNGADLWSLVTHAVRLKSVPPGVVTAGSPQEA